MKDGLRDASIDDQNACAHLAQARACGLERLNGLAPGARRIADGGNPNRVRKISQKKQVDRSRSLDWEPRKGSTLPRPGRHFSFGAPVEPRNIKLKSSVC